MRGLVLFVAGVLCGAVATYVAMVPRTHAPHPVVVAPDAGPVPTNGAPATQASPPSTPPAAANTSPNEVVAGAAPPVAPGAEGTTSAGANASGDAPLIPVEGVQPQQLSDTFTDARAAGRSHDAIDIMAPKGTRVLAAADGTVVKLFTSVRGGLTVYVFDPGRTLEYYYAHLDGYAPGLAEGSTLHRGDLIGFVGSTGDASPDAPHLHFEIALLGPEQQWWHATDLNPYPILTGRQSLADAVASATQSAPR